ncbi:MAG: hypothetical protein M5U24_03865, partial [Candidatus Kuenenia sp.]|uniref:hypothetical protein n=1 Tax=Candidatus Kuenenia sp. TaxID=2499824 RepID=UPI0022BE69FE
ISSSPISGRAKGKKSVISHPFFLELFSSAVIILYTLRIILSNLFPFTHSTKQSINVKWVK